MQGWKIGVIVGSILLFLLILGLALGLTLTKKESENPETENPESETPETENPESENPESEIPENEPPVEEEEPVEACTPGDVDAWGRVCGTLGSDFFGQEPMDYIAGINLLNGVAYKVNITNDSSNNNFTGLVFEGNQSAIKGAAYYSSVDILGDAFYVYGMGNTELVQTNQPVLIYYKDAHGAKYYWNKYTNPTLVISTVSDDMSNQAVWWYFQDILDPQIDTMVYLNTNYYISSQPLVNIDQWLQSGGSTLQLDRGKYDFDLYYARGEHYPHGMSYFKVKHV